MSVEILSYRYSNKPVFTAVDTEKFYFDDIIAFTLGERLLEGPLVELEFENRMVNYLYTCLGELDKPNVQVIYQEIQKRVEEVTNEYIYHLLLTSGELYLKYEYQLSKRFTTLRLYVDKTLDQRDLA